MIGGIDEYDYLELEYSNKAHIEAKLKEVEKLCQMANVNVVDCKVYNDLIIDLRSVCNTINSLTNRICELERNQFKSKIEDLSVSNEEIGDFVL